MTAAEVAPVVNACKEGVYFVTERNYQVGDEVLVAFPYTGVSDVEQDGCVVRIDEREAGRRGVAVAMGQAAIRAVAALGAPADDRKTVRVISLAEALPEAVGPPAAVPADVSELGLELAREREKARRLEQELADLTLAYEQVSTERDQLTVEDKDTDRRVRELTADKAAMSDVIEDLKRDLNMLRDQLEAVQAQQREAQGAEAAAAQAAERAPVAEPAEKPAVVRGAEPAPPAPTELPTRLGPSYVQQLESEVLLLREEVEALRARLPAAPAGEEALRPAEPPAPYDWRVEQIRTARTRLIEELEEQIEKLRTQLAEAQAEPQQQAAMTRVTQDLEQQIKTLRNQLAVAEAGREERESMARLIEELKREIGQLRGRLAVAEAESGQKELMARIVDELKQQVETLRNQVQATESEDRQRAGMLQVLLGQVHTLRDQLAAAEAERAEKATLLHLVEVQKQQIEGLHDKLADAEKAHAEKAAMAQTIEEQGRALETLRERLAGSELEVEEKARLRHEAEDLREQVKALTSQLAALKPEGGKAPEQKVAPRRRGAEPGPGPTAEREAQISEMREQIQDMSARIQEMRSETVAPLTILSAYCDMLRMNKSLDPETRKTLTEMAEQASLLRKAFQKFGRKSTRND